MRMSKNDKFEIQRTIRRMERENNFGFWVYGGCLAVGTWLSWSDFSTAELTIFLLIAYLGGFILQEVRQVRLDVLRASLRQVLIAKDPSILTDDEW